MTREEFFQTPLSWRLGVPLFAIALGSLIWGLGINRDLFYLINALHQLAPDSFWAKLTVLGDALLALPLTLIFVRFMPRVLAPMFIATLITPTVLHLIKGIANQARPGGIISPIDFHYIEPLYTHHSFPSGHSTMAFAWVGVVIFQLQGPARRLWANMLLIIASCVALSRVIVGAHWPVDICFGAALGWSGAMLATWLAIRWQALSSDNAHKWLVGFFMLLALLSLFFIDNDYAHVSGWQSGVVLFSILLAMMPKLDKLIYAMSNCDAQSLHPKTLIRKLFTVLFQAARDIAASLQQFCPDCWQRFKAATFEAGQGRKWVFHISFLLILVLLVEIMIGWSTLLKPWGSIPVDKLLIAIFLLLTSYLFRALRLVFYFDEIRVASSLACLRLSVIHNFYNNLLPMRSGELAFPLLMSKQFQIPYQKSLTALLWLRLLDLAAILMIGGIAALLVFDFKWIAMLSVLFIILLPLWLASWFNHFSRLLLRRKPEWEEKIEMIRQGWPQHRMAIWRSWGWTLLNWVVKLISFALVLQWFIDLQAVYALVAIISAELSSVLPIHSVAGFGTYESAALIGLSIFGQSSAEALKAVVNLHLFVIGMTLISGFIAQLLGKNSPLLKFRSLLSRNSHV
jgi:glycosyltransferase 2 family protein